MVKITAEERNMTETDQEIITPETNGKLTALEALRAKSQAADNDAIIPDVTIAPKPKPTESLELPKFSDLGGILPPAEVVASQEKSAFVEKTPRSISATVEFPATLNISNIPVEEEKAPDATAKAKKTIGTGWLKKLSKDGAPSSKSSELLSLSLSNLERNVTTAT